MKQQCDFKQKPQKMGRKAKKMESAVEEVRLKEKKAKVPKQISPKMDVLQVARKLGATIRSRAARYALDVKQPSSNALTSWFKVDAKEAPPPVYDYTKDEVVMGEISTIRSAVRMAFGLKPIHVEVPFMLDMKSTAATGIVNTVANVDVTATTEFGALASLFDEYRTLGFTYDFYVPASTAFWSNTSTGALDSTWMCSISYDPADNTAVTSTLINTQQAQHILLAPRPVMYDGVGNKLVGLFTQVDSQRPFRFKVAITPVAETLVNAGTATTPGMWKPTTAGTLPDGYIKPYLVSSLTTASVGISGVLRLITEWRSRT